MQMSGIFDGPTRARNDPANRRHDFRSMTPAHVRDTAAAARLVHALADQESIALDCEAAGFHRYSDRLCLIQISTRRETYLVDPLAFDPAPALRPILEDPEVEVLMHGGDFDLRLLDRDLDINVRGLFDTQAAAQILGERALGLASLLEEHLGVSLSKKYQRADWAQRPLPDEMAAYAAADTRHLHELADILKERLQEVGRMSWAREESKALEGTSWEDGPEEDPVTRVDAARSMAPRAVTALRQALDWRDQVARERDRAAFRIAGDDALVGVVHERPTDIEALGRIRGFSPALAREKGGALLERLQRVDGLPDDELEPYPRASSRDNARPPPEVEERTRVLKKVRNRRADELGIDRGALIPNRTLLEIARHEPASLTELKAVPGVRSWQAEAAGSELLAALGPAVRS